MLRILDLEAPGVHDWLEQEGFDGATILLAAGAPVLHPGWQVDPKDLEILHKPFSYSRLESRILARLTPEEPVGRLSVDPILDTDEPALQTVLDRARRLARGSLAISLVGELGSGRRALAERIHAWSPRRNGPLVLLERAELESLGQARIEEVLAAAIARAGEGTLVWVEPAEQPPRVQQAILSVLRSAGPEGPRWLSIARSPLEASVRDGSLLLELQYRLEVTSLRIPPLRERLRDWESICRSAAARVARALGQALPTIDEELVELLARDGFPGNWIGLESRLRGILLQGGQGDPSLHALAGSESMRGAGASPGPRLNLKSLERDTIIRALAHWDGNRTRASESLGISVRTLRNKIREYDLR
jgi:two-component system response regulator FlrC